MFIINYRLLKVVLKQLRDQFLTVTLAMTHKVLDMNAG